ncbi:MAG: ABC transporter ATP-binding protein, partial [Clostridiales Family XIII bacterium]|nr:ABC transporter ATP-binding protein [Clostridiales Family XIII bacterium]
MNGSFLSIKDLKINYRAFDGVKTVLDIDSLEVERGSVYGIVGESGAGKTVLALAIQGLLSMPPGEIERGEILLDGENILEKTPAQLAHMRGKKTSMIFQDPMSALNPVFAVGYQMRRVALANGFAKKAEADQKALDMLRAVKLPDPESVMRKYPHELSGGQRQRIIIGMALLCGAELIIADEPTRNLDVTVQAGILKLLKELQQTLNVTVLFIANNLVLVSALCDRACVLKEGSIVEQGVARDILDNPQHAYTRLLLDSVAPARIKGNALPEGPPVVEVFGLKKFFPVKNEFRTKKGEFVRAVDGVSFQVPKGGALGIVGESGCGKSTLVNTLLLLHKPTEGDVRFDGKAIFRLGKRALRAARKDVQIVFQDPFWSLDPRWLVKDIIGEPLRVHKHLSPDAYIKEVQTLMEMVGLRSGDIYKYPHEFSGGQRQRIAIARALSVRPK